MTLDTPLSKALATTKPKLAILETMGLRTVADLLEYFPRAYEDLSSVVPISMFALGQRNTSRGMLMPVKSVRTRFGKQIQRSTFIDEQGGICECIWFNQPHLARMYPKETSVLISGVVKGMPGNFTLQSPTVEAITEEMVHTARIVPVYPETEGMTSKWLREKISDVLSATNLIEEFLPTDFLEMNHYPIRSKAISEIHFPTTKESLDKAKERLAFEEVFLFQLKALKSKYAWQHMQVAKEIPMDVELIKKILTTLPFQLTNAQKITLYEILEDMGKTQPMLRLLQGDVGSGKTIVAFLAALSAYHRGFQCAVMAPTEILAKQHFQKFHECLELFQNHPELQNLLPRIELLIGSLAEKDKSQIRDQVASGDVGIIVGTHALIQEHVKFHSLGLAIIDEQHRFGVEQRAKLASHGAPHLLMMTATPIPRTLALTLFGDQDLSIIDEMPPGRKEIITRVIQESKRHQTILFIKDQIQKGRQVFVICPLINESEKLELKSVMEEYEKLRDTVFPEFKVTYLHGKMKSETKDAIMQDFKDKKYDILVSTSVIEVGIDIPNSTVMMIESAERFGLSQLHQFRGRVGRSGHQSYCFLFITDPDESAPARLRAMEKHADGFSLSEIDMKIRGPGQVFGTRQSGMPDFKIASLFDGRIIARARKFAQEMIGLDPKLSHIPLIGKKLRLMDGTYLQA